MHEYNRALISLLVAHPHEDSPEILQHVADSESHYRDAARCEAAANHQRESGGDSLKVAELMGAYAAETMMAERETTLAYAAFNRIEPPAFLREIRPQARALGVLADADAR